MRGLVQESLKPLCPGKKLKVTPGNLKKSEITLEYISSPARRNSVMWDAPVNRILIFETHFLRDCKRKEHFKNKKQRRSRRV